MLPRKKMRESLRRRKWRRSRKKRRSLLILTRWTSEANSWRNSVHT